MVNTWNEVTEPINRWLSLPDKLWNTTVKNFGTLYFRLQTSWAAPLNLMTSITHFIFTEFFITYVTKSGVIINQFIMHCHYHTFWELKLFINVFFMLFSSVSINICATSSSLNCFTKVTGGWEESVTSKTLYVVTKSAGDVFLILLGVALLMVWLKISIYNKWDPHWPIVIFKRYFRSLFGKFNFYNVVWFTILMMRRC